MKIKWNCPKCGNDEIEVITFREDITGKVFISHGVCVQCLANVCLPTEPVEWLNRGVKNE